MNKNDVVLALKDFDLSSISIIEQNGSVIIQAKDLNIDEIIEKIKCFFPDSNITKEHYDMAINDGFNVGKYEDYPIIIIK